MSAAQAAPPVRQLQLAETGDADRRETESGQPQRRPEGLIPTHPRHRHESADENHAHAEHLEDHGIPVKKTQT